MVRVLLLTAAHCDLKPENLVFDSRLPDAKLKVVDMGLCEFFDRRKHFNRLKGSLLYAAPEMLRQNYNHKVDVWACGVILYILVTGEPPFEARRTTSCGRHVLDYPQTQARILEAKPDFRKLGFDCVEGDIVGLLRAMLTADPDRRPDAFQLLGHPWLHKTSERISKNKAASCLVTRQQIGRNLFAFGKSKILRQGVYMFLANYFDLKHEKAFLVAHFREMDIDCDGELSFDELCACYSVKVRLMLVRAPHRRERGRQNLRVCALGQAQASQPARVFFGQHSVPRNRYHQACALRVQAN